MATHRRRTRQGGIAIVFYASMLTFVVGCVGLAVDAGTIYIIKARLTAAVDAAALAAGRSVNLADTVDQATTQATTTANQFFTANFPTGYFNSVGAPTVTPNFTQESDANGNPNGVLDISVTANVTAPTYFMNIFNVHSVTVGDTGTASRRGLVLMLVLDTSISMNTPTTPSACDAMKTAAQNFITLFSPYDQIGLVTFDIQPYLKEAPTTSRSGVNADIGAITCGSSTNTTGALHMAYQEIQAANLPLALNTIVLFTDGSPNGITATFPARTVADNRWGPALGTNGQPSGPAPPAQSGTTYTHTNNCSDTGPQDANSTNEEAICVAMPAVCTDSTATFSGTIAQGAAQDPWGGTTSIDTTGLTIGTSCTNTSALPGSNIRQFIAYIPDTDTYGNSLHGVIATGAGPTVSGGRVTRDNWLFQTNSLCSPDMTVQPNCKNTGDLWSNHTTIGSGSNKFPVGYTYAGFLRPDQPNTLVAAGMNGAMDQANTIRSDTTYHIVIHTIYLTGNATDAVDREFLPVIANAASITALPYDPVSFTPYANPAYQTSQETGKYLVTSDKTQLTSLFAQLASEVLRLSK